MKPKRSGVCSRSGYALPKANPRPLILIDAHALTVIVAGYLLLLCDDGRLQARIADPRFKLPKTYLVQVEGDPQEPELERLRQGVRLKDGMTLPAEVARIDAPNVWQRDPPIRQRKLIPDSWLEITIREGRNRQVRRMTAAIGLPTLRLVRWSIGDWSVAGIAPGEFADMSTPPDRWFK